MKSAAASMAVFHQKAACREFNSCVADGTDRATLCGDIAGMVAAMTECELDVASERSSGNTLG